MKDTENQALDAQYGGRGEMAGWPEPSEGKKPKPDDVKVEVKPTPLMHARQQIMAKNIELSAAQWQLEKFSTQLGKMAEEVKDVSAESRSLSVRNDAKADHLATLAQSLEEAQRNLAELRTQLDDAHGVIVELQNDKAELSAKVEAAATALFDAHESIGTALDDNKGLRETIHDLKANMSFPNVRKGQKLADDYFEEIQKQKLIIKALEADNNILDGRVSKYHVEVLEYINANANLNDKVKGYEVSIADLQDDVSELTREIESRKREIEAQTKAYIAEQHKRKEPPTRANYMLDPKLIAVAKSYEDEIESKAKLISQRTAALTELKETIKSLQYKNSHLEAQAKKIDVSDELEVELNRSVNLCSKQQKTIRAGGVELDLTRSKLTTVRESNNRAVRIILNMSKRLSDSDPDKHTAEFKGIVDKCNEVLKAKADRIEVLETKLDAATSGFNDNGPVSTPSRES